VRARKGPGRHLCVCLRRTEKRQEKHACSVAQTDSSVDRRPVRAACDGERELDSAQSAWGFHAIRGH
jgi:hypothetical protein